MDDRDADKLDIWRKSPLRYLGYANEVGESFRPVFAKGVLPSYIVSFSYVLCDTADKALRASHTSSHRTEEQRQLRIASAAADTLVWQVMASVVLPGVTINRLVAAANALATRSCTNPLIHRWAPVAFGLSMIPVIMHPIDACVDFVLDRTTRPYLLLEESSSSIADLTGGGGGGERYSTTTTVGIMNVVFRGDAAVTLTSLFRCVDWIDGVDCVSRPLAVYDDAEQLNTDFLHLCQEKTWSRHDQHSVLELGSGCGLCGIVAATQGFNVTLSDQDELIELLQHNVRQNAHLYPDDERIVQVVGHSWGNESTGAMKSSYDVILISDCINPIYGQHSWRMLAKSCSRFSSRTSKILLSVEQRGNGEALDDFFSCTSNTFSHSLVHHEGQVNVYELGALQ